MKVRDGLGKWIVRQLLYKYVPKDLVDRPKMGFGVPVFAWLRTDIRFYCDEYLSDTAFAEHGLFKQEEIDHIKRSFFAGDRNYNSLFWYILMFQMWYKKWM